MPLGVGIVGAGRLGLKRAGALPGAKLTAVCDIDITRAEDLAKQFGGHVVPDWTTLVSLPEVDIVIVATPNRYLPEVAAAAIANRKHVLLEKPAGCEAAQLRALGEIAGPCRVRVGYNHRFHPAIQKALDIVAQGIVGPIMFIRGRYGHGGREGYEKDWRFDPELSGGGELIDQGVHLIDLSRLFMGDFAEVSAFLPTYFWPVAVEDNAFLLLKTSDHRAAWLHASCTEWKNLFSFEIYGRDGKLVVDGLGGSYGIERLSLFKMTASMGPPETTIWEFAGPDRSWDLEFSEFVGDIHEGRNPSPGLLDAIAVLDLVEKAYGR